MNIKNNAINMNINNDQNYKKTDNNITENKLTTLNNKIEIKENINLFYWNVRSIKSLAKKTICKDNSLQVIVLNEPWEKWESIHF